MIAQRCFSVWEASQGINLEAKRIKLVLWLGLLERFPTMRGEPELSGPPLLQFGFEVGVGWGIKQPSSPAMVSRFSSHTALFSHTHSSACVHLRPGSGVSASWSLDVVSSFLRLRVVLKAGLRSVRLSCGWSYAVSAVTLGGVSGGLHICMYSSSVEERTVLGMRVALLRRRQMGSSAHLKKSR